MKILRMIVAGLAGFACAVSLVGIVYLFTLQATVMNRSAVKSWISDNKIYDGKLITALVQTSSADSPQSNIPSSAINVSPEIIKSAMVATFPPDFVQMHTEAVIDSAYDWIEGKSPEFKFSIPIDQKRDTFIQQLSKSLEPQVTVLPVCGSVRIAQNIACRPPNLTAEQFAVQITTQSLSASETFTTPLTNESFSQSTQNDTPQPGTSLLPRLPMLHAATDMLFVILPTIAIISVLTVIFVNTAGHRLVASARLARLIFFSMLVTFTPALIILFILKYNDFGLVNLFGAQMGELIVPLIKTIIIDIAYNLAIFSGIAGILAVITWIILSVQQQRLLKNTAQIQ
ncbi:MAG: hypothetical protein JWO55_39 [Candidatus Saccharibacteria bacterium]|jgi:hypothetical protein|nr:hypothetical protein [Candidatus Saccharibacteria bacterium]